MAEVETYNTHHQNLQPKDMNNNLADNNNNNNEDDKEKDKKIKKDLFKNVPDIIEEYRRNETTPRHKYSKGYVLGKVSRTKYILPCNFLLIYLFFSILLGWFCSSLFLCSIRVKEKICYKNCFQEFNH